MAVPLLLLAPPALESCLEPTEVTVIVSTDLDCPSTASSRPHLLGTEVLLQQGDGSWARAGGTSACSANGGVGRLVITPGAGQRFRLRVSGAVDWPGHAKPDPITSDRVVTFVSHTPLELPVELSMSCIGVRCDDPDTTCAHGSCVPVQAACVGRRCDVDSGSDAAPPADAGPDAAPDAVAEAGFDAAGCTSPLVGPYNYHWPFNEGMGAPQVVEEISKVGSPLTGALSVGGPCNGMLVITGGKSQTLFGTKMWTIPKFGVGFWLYFLGGTGTLLSRGAPGAGGFEIKIDAQASTFIVYGPASNTTAGINPPPLSKWVRVYAAHTATGVTFSIDNLVSVPASPVAAFITSSSDVVVGDGGTLAFAIADLYLGPP